MIIKDVLLTDFSDYKWDNFDVSDACLQIEQLVERANAGILLGGIGDTAVLPNGDFDVKKASHLVRNLKFKKNKVIADIEILDTKYGKKVIDLLESECVTYRMRGTSNLKLKNKESNKPCIKIFGWDFVKI